MPLWCPGKPVASAWGAVAEGLVCKDDVGGELRPRLCPSGSGAVEGRVCRDVGGAAACSASAGARASSRNSFATGASSHTGVTSRLSTVERVKKLRCCRCVARALPNHGASSATAVASSLADGAALANGAARGPALAAASSLASCSRSARMRSRMPSYGLPSLRSWAWLSRSEMRRAPRARGEHSEKSALPQPSTTSAPRAGAGNARSPAPRRGRGASATSDPQMASLTGSHSAYGSLDAPAW